MSIQFNQSLTARIIFIFLAILGVTLLCFTPDDVFAEGGGSTEPGTQSVIIDPPDTNEPEPPTQSQAEGGSDIMLIDLALLLLNTI